jgi:hypothetical protein
MYQFSSLVSYSFHVPTSSCKDGLAAASMFNPFDEDPVISSSMHAAAIAAATDRLREEYTAAAAADGLLRVFLFVLKWDDGGVISKHRSAYPGLVTVLNISERCIQSPHGKVRRLLVHGDCTLHLLYM